MFHQPTVINAKATLQRARRWLLGMLVESSLPIALFLILMIITLILNFLF